jgi:hypothetical protein
LAIIGDVLGDCAGGRATALSDIITTIVDAARWTSRANFDATPL